MENSFLAPITELTLSNGETVSIGGKKDRPQVISFWASWCPPCREEFGELERFFAAHQDEIYFYAVNEDETLEPAQNFLDERAENYDLLPIIFDFDHTVGQNFEVEYMPTTYIVDTNGVVKAFHVGGVTQAVLENSLALLE